MSFKRETRTFQIERTEDVNIIECDFCHKQVIETGVFSDAPVTDRLNWLRLFKFTDNPGVETHWDFCTDKCLVSYMLLHADKSS